MSSEDLIRAVLGPVISLLVILGLSFPLWRLTSWLELRKKEKRARSLLAYQAAQFRLLVDLVNDVKRYGPEVKQSPPEVKQEGGEP